jgi:hypothetical protein
MAGRTFTLDGLTVRQSAAVRTVVAVHESQKANGWLGLGDGAGVLLGCTDVARRVETSVGQVVEMYQEGADLIRERLG